LINLDSNPEADPLLLHAPGVFAHISETCGGVAGVTQYVTAPARVFVFARQKLAIRYQLSDQERVRWALCEPTLCV
jgi:hypothetical protein